MRRLTRTNLYPKPNVELGLSDWVVRTVVTLSTTTNNPISGTTSLLATATGSAFSFKTSTVSVTANQTYSYSIAIKSVNAAFTNVRLVLDWWTDAGFISSDQSSAYSSPLGSVVTTLKHSANAPATATKLSAYIIVFDSVSGDQLMADDVLVEQAPAPGNYFDGSFPETATLFYKWSGTPNASTSEQYEIFNSEVYNPSKAMDDAKVEALERILGANPPAREVEFTFNDIRYRALEKVLSDNGQL